MKTRNVIAISVSLIALAACDTNYNSRAECERATAGYYGRAGGFAVGSAFGSGWGNVAAAAGGTVLGGEAGKVMYDQTRPNGQHPQDNRPYVQNWYGECRPAR